MEEAITATASRSDGWWSVVVEIPGHTSYTQGRTLREARRMAEDVVRLWGEELDDPTLGAKDIEFEVAGAQKELVNDYLAAREAEEKASAAAQVKQLSTVAKLRSQGLSVQDVADLLGISKGRVSQLAKRA